MTPEQVDKAIALLNLWCHLYDNSDITCGICCCGEEINGHSLSSGHAATDQSSYFATSLYEDTKVLLIGIEK